MSMTTELIDRLKLLSSYLSDDDTFEVAIRKSMREAADTIHLLSEKLHASQMERSSQYYHGGWIPVSERLPKENGMYIVTAKNLTGYSRLECEVFECMFLYGDWQFRGWEDNKVIAWMPLPKPWKEGDAE